MSNRIRATLAVALVMQFTAVGGTQEDGKSLVLAGAKIYTISGGIIEQGNVIIRDGKIVAVGRVDLAPVPPDADVRDMSGKVIIPGLVDTHSHVGILSLPPARANSDGNESSGPTQAVLRAIDAIQPGDPGIRMALAGGVTTANIMPGSGNVMGGQTAYVKLRGRTIEEMLINSEGMSGGMKMANGENPKRNYGSRDRAPATRMAVAGLQRKVFVDARNYLAKLERHEQKQAAGEESDPPDRDIALEPIVEILRGERTVHFHSHRADDLLTAMRISEEFGFKLVLQHVTEGYKVAAEIAARGVPCSIILLDSPGGKHEASDFLLDNGAILEQAGVKIAIHTDDPVTPSRLLLRSGALAVRNGMTEEGALRALTIHPAEMMDLGDRIGSIEVDKDADLVVLSGEPFSVYTHVLETYIDGERVFDRSDPGDRLHATGGFAVADRYPAMEAAQ